MAKNRGEPLKMTHTSETEFFQGGPHGRVIAPVILVICPVGKNRDSKTKKMTFAFLVILGLILTFLIHLVPCPTKRKKCEQGA